MENGLTRLRDPESTIRAGSISSEGIEMETPWHYHDLHQLLYAFEDSVEVEAEAARYKVPNQFAAWIPAGMMHRTAIQNVRSGSIFFKPELIQVPAKNLRVIPASNLMREMIRYSMRWPIDGQDDDVSIAFFECFAKLCSEWIAQEVKLVLPSSDAPRINSIVEFTRKNLSTVSLADVCNAAGMSERSLRRHFQRSMGITWDDYRMRLRMYEAIDSLDNTNKLVGEIAADVGYASQAAFAKAFRSIMGISPAAYRRAQR